MAKSGNKSAKNHKGTTVWIDRLTSEKLRELASKNRRSKAGQIRWMVDLELEKAAVGQVDLPPKISE